MFDFDSIYYKSLGKNTQKKSTITINILIILRQNNCITKEKGIKGIIDYLDHLLITNWTKANF